MHSAPAPKSNAVVNTYMRLILNLCALASWQYTLIATQPCMNQHTVSSLHHRASAPAHRFLKRTTKYQTNNHTTRRSTYTTPDLPPTLPARLAVRKGIHSNNYRPLKSSQPTPNTLLHLLPEQNPYSKTPTSCRKPYSILPPFSLPPAPTQCTALQLPNPIQSLTRICASSCIFAHQLRGNIR